MEKIEVFYNKGVESFLNNLVDILFKKEYFGFKKTSKEYVAKITFEINSEIHLKRHHESPKQLIKYGKYYIKVKGSHRTMWYVFFDKKDNRYFIEYITNNHVATAAFIKDL
ncbi:MAG: hypothetical protein ACYDCN_02365 [Bacteroidia bacterium]